MFILSIQFVNNLETRAFVLTAVRSTIDKRQQLRYPPFSNPIFSEYPSQMFQKSLTTTLPAVERIVDFHHLVVAHAVRTKRAATFTKRQQPCAAKSGDVCTCQMPMETCRMPGKEVKEMNILEMEGVENRRKTRNYGIINVSAVYIHSISFFL